MNSVKLKYRDKEHLELINSAGISSISTDDLLTNSFLKEINSMSDNTKYSSDYINEIFMYFGITGLMYEKVFLTYGVTKIIVSDIDIDDKVFISKAIKNNIKMSSFTLVKYRIKSIFKLIVAVVISLFMSLLIPLYIFLFIKKKGKPKTINNACVVRSSATDKKISSLQEEFNINFFSDNLVYKKSNYTSLYISSLLNQITAVFIIPIITVRDFIWLHKESKQYFDIFFLGHFLYQYIFRIAFKSTYEYYFDRLMKESVGPYYTGNKEDRYAICEKRIAKKYFKETVCFPHGLEYAFKEPAGLVGDTFYCTSKESKKTLSKLYIDNKFVFDLEITRKMFSILNKSNQVSQRKIVFFTEAKTNQDIEINKKIIHFLIKNGIKLFLKLHPKDSIVNYLEFTNDIFVVDNLNDAISNNICVARKSTVLIEAIYNNSTSVAILIDPSDKNKYENWFPSLNTDEIIKLYSLDTLVKELQKEWV